jgi:hypothetical protein
LVLQLVLKIRKPFLSAASLESRLVFCVVFFQWICHGLILSYPVESLKTGDAPHHLAQSRFPEIGTTLHDDFPIASDAGID